MPDTASADILLQLSTAAAAAVDRAARSVVAVHGRDRRGASGVLWRDGVVVAASDAVERDEELAVTLPDGQRLAATLVGRDPTTDIAVLRIEGMPGVTAAEAGDPAALRPGHIVFAVGRHAEEGAAVVASFGIVATSAGPWRSMRGGAIDRLIRLDLRLDPATEGGALVDASGRTMGIVVPGPRRRVLAIPAATIDRVADQLLAKGRIPRGYLGLRMQRVRLDAQLAQSLSPPRRTGVIVVSVDPEGPGGRAGLVLGDLLTTWDGSPISDVRDIMERLGPESVGTAIELGLIRAGTPTSASLAIVERPAAA
jgi:S1-C subfamily serine protease